MGDRRIATLPETEQDKLILDTFCYAYKGPKAVEYFEKAFKILESGL
jgi:hypothetical protein